MITMNEKGKLTVPSFPGNKLYAVCKKAVERFGWTLQKDVIHEEIGEFIHAFSKLERFRTMNNNVPLSKQASANYESLIIELAGEIADALIVIQEVIGQYNLESFVLTIMENKLNRLERRIKESDKYESKDD